MQNDIFRASTFASPLQKGFVIPSSSTTNGVLLTSRSLNRYASLLLRTVKISMKQNTKCLLARWARFLPFVAVSSSIPSMKVSPQTPTQFEPSDKSATLDSSDSASVDLCNRNRRSHRSGGSSTCAGIVYCGHPLLSLPSRSLISKVGQLEVYDGFVRVRR